MLEVEAAAKLRYKCEWQRIRNEIVVLQRVIELFRRATSSGRKRTATLLG